MIPACNIVTRRDRNDSTKSGYLALTQPIALNCGVSGAYLSAPTKEREMALRRAGSKKKAKSKGKSAAKKKAPARTKGRGAGTQAAAAAKEKVDV
jgi:hypothetical protein